ncbi:MAG: NPCBM/NEW2 domain-containing protein [Verrucomicrobiota bacterium]|nr:NPCBM/NEW2 domain-containing protein [Verrucomicrobiota bacterium]
MFALSARSADLPPELKSTVLSGPKITPCPACLCAAPTGEVFVGVDMLGSLGKGPGKGKIVRVTDTDQDGVADEHTVFAELDNPRGLISVGKKLFVLHTVIPKTTGKLEAMHLSVLEDNNWDGKADGPAKILISDISPPKHNQARGADHTTNGIRMGIDGWIYIAVGDFGIHGAKGTDGTELTMLGGGVVRVRPDGKEMEVYTHGLRNIYDVAIDPFMNIYTRGNTNDGGGWNVRFIHHVQGGEYGYPILFKNFTGEVIPALADLGGGSGTGAMFFQEPGWPEKYNNVAMMCDWGRSQLIIHRVTPDGPSFTQAPENFIKLHQITDVDSDASGRLYAGAWAGAGYRGSPNKGWVECIVPQNWKYRPFTAPAELKDKPLVELLRSESASARLAASQELLKRPGLAAAVAAIAVDKKTDLYSRVAAIFTYRQMAGNKAVAILKQLAADPAVKEWALRALADRKSQLEGVSTSLFTTALKDDNPRVRVAAAVGLGRLGNYPFARGCFDDAAAALLSVATPPGKEQPIAAPAASPAFQTKAFKGHKTHSVDVDVKTFKELYLVVNNAGDGDGEDHGAWFNPVFENAAGKQVKLADLKWKSAKSGWGKIGFGISATGAPLKSGDGKAQPDGLGTHANSVIVYAVPKGSVKFKARVGLASTSKARGKIQFIVSGSMPSIPGTSSSKEGPHATPNSEIILPHVAVNSLIELNAIEGCVNAVGSSKSRGALWALSKMHDTRVIDGLIAKYQSSAGDRAGILRTLIRLYHIEAPYDGSWWWSTRPDTRGPYYKPIKWDGSEKIADFVKACWNRGEFRGVIAANNAKTRSAIAGIDASQVASTPSGPDEPKVDLSAIARTKGQVGKMSIEDIILAIADVKGDAKKGEALFTRQGCIACHTTRSDQAPKGPFMGQVGSILSRDQIAESILKPNASISQGFATVSLSTKDKKTMVGFVTAETADTLEMRDIAGQVHRFSKNNIAGRKELPISMMPAGLANALSIEEFASLLSYLEGMKGK